MAVNIDKQPLGGINTDVNIQNVPTADYLDALNITAKRRQAESGEDIYPLLGEEYPFAQGPVFTQTDIITSGRMIRVYCPKKFDPAIWPAVTLGNFITRNANGTPITPTGPGLVGGTSWGTLTADWNTYLTSLAYNSGTATFIPVLDNNEYDGFIEIIVDRIGLYTIEFTSLYSGYDLPIQIMEDVITTNFYSRGEISKIIGSCRDARGTYLFITPVVKADGNGILPSIISVTNTVEAAICSNTIIEFNAPHGLFQWERIMIAGVTDSTHINGLWQVVIVNETEVALVSSALTVFVAGTGTNGVCTFMHDSMGSICYVESDQNVLGGIENNFGARLTELIKTTSFDFNHENPIDATAKYNNFSSIVKWTDNNSKPKMLVYNGYPFITGGYIYGSVNGVGGFNWAAEYYLETIAYTSNLQVPEQGFKLSVTQNNTGQLTPSNKIYLVAGVTDDGYVTTYSFPTNPINSVVKNAVGVTAAESWTYTGNTYNEVATNKANIIQVDNIPAGFYDRLRVICLRYSPLAFDLFQFAEVTLTANQTSATIPHIGNENNLPISVAEASQVYAQISRALNISELLNSTILSNLTYEVDEDLSEVVNGINYQVRYQTQLTPYGPVPATLTNLFPTGEYADPNGQVNKMGFMLLETVRVGIIFKRRNGGWTKTYHIDDIRIDDSPASGKRLSGLSDLRYYFGDVPVLQFVGLDWNYVLPSGLKLREVYEDARFVRAEVVQQVRLSGLLFRSTDIGGYNYLDPTSVNPLTPVPPGAVNTNAQRLLYLMTFDGMNSSTPAYTGESGLQIVNFGCPIIGTTTAATTPPNSSLFEYEQWVSDSATLQTVNVVNIQQLPEGASSVNVGGYITVAQDANGDILGAYPYQSPLASRIYAVAVDSDIINATTSVNPDIGVYACFVYQPNPAQYPLNPADSVYYDMGYNGVDADNDTVATTYLIEGGGNCYAQRTYMGLRLVTNYLTGVQSYFAGISFPMYNRNNAQVAKRTFPGGFSGTSPASLQVAVDNFVSPLSVLASSGNYLEYSQAFTRRLYLPQIAGYDPNIPELGSAQATVAYSLQSIENSKWNNDRVFLPLNRRDLELKYGPIWGSFVLNKILVTVQTDYIERQYFDNTGYLIGSSGPAILGTGDTMGRKGDSISMLGSSNKWGMFLGMSNSGNDFLYGVDGKRFKFWRVGADGTTVLTDAYKIDFLSKKNLTLAKFYKNPIIGKGITGVYDIKNEAAIWSSVVWKDTQLWVSGIEYKPGDVVRDEACDYFYEGVPVLFVCIETHLATDLDRPRLNNSLSQQYWQAIPLTNTDYYNVFTLVFYEDKNVFKTFLGYYHGHMAGFEDTFIVQPNSNRFFNPINVTVYDVLDATINGLGYNIDISTTSLLGEGVGIYVSGVTGLTGIDGYYTYLPPMLTGPHTYNIIDGDTIYLNTGGAVSGTWGGGGTVSLTGAPGLSKPTFLYVHRELCSVLKWYPLPYSISGVAYSWTTGDTFVVVGTILPSLIPSSAFWENMVLTFDFGGDIREATLLTDDTIYFTEPLTNTGSSNTLDFTVYLSKDAYITPVVNESRGALVKYCNFRFNSLEAPYRVDVETAVHNSHLLESDFVSYDTIHDSPIKMDVTGGYNPDTGVSVVFGKYMKVKITFRRLIEQFIHNFGVGIRLMSSEKKRRS